MGTQASWMVPMVGKGERLEVCFEIKGNGEVDGDILNKFHGVHFGDEIESEDLPEPVVEDVAADDVSDEAVEDAEEKPKVTWRNDVLERVMGAHGIDLELKDSFIEHAVNFDSDDNGYLKKAELEEAAKAWNADNSSEESEVEESNEDDTNAQQAQPEEEGEVKACPVCPTPSPSDAAVCSACGFSFVDL